MGFTSRSKSTVTLAGDGSLPVSTSAASRTVAVTPSKTTQRHTRATPSVKRGAPFDAKLSLFVCVLLFTFARRASISEFRADI